MINHPVHITGKSGLSAFIPFCFLCDNIDIIGRRLDGFEIPVCSLFREKIVGGQVCYEADVNQFKKDVQWLEALHKGFGFIIDTNDEYDMKNLFFKQYSVPEVKNKNVRIYNDNENENDFLIMLQTISIFYVNCFLNTGVEFNITL